MAMRLLGGSNGVATVSSSIVEYEITAAAKHLEIKCDKASAANLRWQIKDGNEITANLTASTGRRLAPGEGWGKPPALGTLQVIAESGTATYEVEILQG